MTTGINIEKLKTSRSGAPLPSETCISKPER